MTTNQQGDVLLFQTLDAGEITVTDGVVTMDGGLRTMAYLCLFGGNEDDDGRKDNPKSWWGNFIENIQARRIRSETQNLLQGLPATSANLLRVQDAATRDLQVFIDENIASSVEVVATIPGLNKLDITVAIEAVGQRSEFTFSANWEASA